MVAAVAEVTGEGQPATIIMNLFLHPPHGLSPSWYSGTPLDVTAYLFQGFHCTPF
jgi:hypothetical protein